LFRSALISTLYARLYAIGSSLDVPWVNIFQDSPVRTQVGKTRAWAQKCANGTPSLPISALVMWAFGIATGKIHTAEKLKMP
jgi:hypothetical protein